MVTKGVQRTSWVHFGTQVKRQKLFFRGSRYYPSPLQFSALALDFSLPLVYTALSNDTNENPSMTFAYLDCPSGISGDMMLGALIDLGLPLDYLNEQIQSVVKSVEVTSSSVIRRGFRAVKAEVHAPHEHVHRTLPDIVQLVEQSKLSPDNKRRVLDIFRLLAEAEAKVHGTGIEEVHFHEVGALDSIADIVGSVVGMDYFGIIEAGASAIPTGYGTVKMAHGECPVPAPATAELLTGIPIAESGVPFELTTPTGAALLKHYVHAGFGKMPAMTIRATGVGAGSRDLPQQPNIFRILLGDLTGKDFATEATIWITETNIDDLSGELIGHCVEQLWTLSPLDVWVTPIQMKKQRPGVTISVLCRQEQINAVEHLLFLETSTLGVRRYPVERTVLRREPCRIKTPWGEVEAKRAVLPDGTEKITPEFESVKRLADGKGVSVQQIMAARITSRLMRSTS